MYFTLLFYFVLCIYRYFLFFLSLCMYLFVNSFIRQSFVIVDMRL